MLERLRYAYDSGIEKSELEFKMEEHDSKNSHVSAFYFIGDKKLNELCGKYEDIDRAWRRYNFFERVAYLIGRIMYYQLYN